MDQNVISANVLQRNLRVLNRKEDRNLQQKLNMLEKQYRYTQKMLQQRRDSLTREHRRVTLVKICQPKATVNIAMTEIGEQQREMHLRASQTASDSRRLYSSRYLHEGSKQSRSASAPLPLPVSPVRRRRHVQSSVSLLQMKNIAKIDSISEKELARQQREAREEMERMRELQREMLQRKVTAFVEMLKDKSNGCREAPNRLGMVQD